MITPDEAVVEAIATVFGRFAELGTGRQVLLSLRGDGLRCRAGRHAPGGGVAAGHLPGGARPAHQSGLCGGVRVRPHPHRETHRCDRQGGAAHRAAPARAVGGAHSDHHPGFIDWATYEANTARLRQNWRAPRGSGGGAPREGAALLQGRLRCGKCGRLMQTGYSGTKGNCPRYVCARAKQLYGGEKGCQSLGGRRLENRILEEMFAVLEPAALAATAQALSDAERSHAANLRAFELSGNGPAMKLSGPGANTTRWSRRIGWSPAPWNGRWRRWPHSAKPNKTFSPPEFAARSSSPTTNSPGCPAPEPTSGRCSTRHRQQLGNASSCCARSCPRSSSLSTARHGWPRCGSSGKAAVLRAGDGADQDWRAFPRHRRRHRRSGAAAGRTLRRHHHRSCLGSTAAPAPGCRSPKAGCTRRGFPAASPPTGRQKLSHPTAMMPPWSASPKPNASSASAK